jgi:hypothetical protein
MEFAFITQHKSKQPDALVAGKNRPASVLRGELRA